MKEEITKKDLEEVLKYCEPEEKAILLLMYSSGMRVNDICNLQIADFLYSLSECSNDNNKDYHNSKELSINIQYPPKFIGSWILHDLKLKKQYVTFSTTESSLAILRSLNIRLSYKFIDICEPLFVGPDGYGITRKDIDATFNRLSDESGINIKPIHLRRLFVETLRSERFYKSTINHFLGNRPDPVTAAYFKINNELLKSEYMKAASKFSCNLSELSIPFDEYIVLLQCLIGFINIT